MYISGEVPDIYVHIVRRVCNNFTQCHCVMCWNNAHIRKCSCHMHSQSAQGVQCLQAVTLCNLFEQSTHQEAFLTYAFLKCAGFVIIAHRYINIFTHTHACTYTDTHTRKCTRTHTHTNTRKHTHIHTYTDTHNCTNTQCHCVIFWNNVYIRKCS